jgi:hypothetical protein
VQVEAGLVEPRPVFERADERVLAEPDDAVLVGSRQEAAGEQHAQAGMADARQRFRARETFSLEVDLGLVPDFEPAPGQRLADFDPRLRRRRHGVD